MVEIVDVRWQCPRGHFVAQDRIHCEDFRDDFAYYGVRTSTEYTCAGCERANVGPYMYFEMPRLVMVRHGDVDEIAVERATYGERVRLTPTERSRAVAVLTGRGLSVRRVAELLHVSTRAVSRHKARLREAA